MGMSASQMRYVLISGKKSDVEYQGQQINQQRTTLATETSALNSQLIALVVPTPPSSDDYTRTSYLFMYNSNKCSITGTTLDETTGLYKINYSYKTTGQEPRNGQGLFQEVSGGYAYVTSSGLTNLTLIDSNNITDPDELTAHQANLETIYQTGYDPGTNYYLYQVGSITRYISEAELNAGIGANTSGQCQYHYIEEDAELTMTGSWEDCTINWTDSGRMSSFTDQYGNVYSLDTSSTTDEDAYNDAMNEYQYQKGIYDQQINNINAQICIIQSQDKTLELKLQDLDTQQQALSTEMDSVKKVIDKNIESSFKAFA